MHDKLTTRNVAWSDWVKVAAATPEKQLLPVEEKIAEVAQRYAELGALHLDVREYLRMQFSLCAKALQSYALQKREMGVCDFIDQEQLLLKALDH